MRGIQISRILNSVKISFFGNKIRFPWLYFTVTLLTLSRSSPFLEQIAISVYGSKFGIPLYVF